MRCCSKKGQPFTEVNMKGIVLRVKSPKNFRTKKHEMAYFFKRYGLFTMFLASILIGLILGIYAGTKTDSEFRMSFDFLFPTDFASRGRQDFITFFCSSFSPAFMFFTAVFLLGFCPWGNCAIPFVTAFKGFGAGLTLAQLCYADGLKGFGFFMLAIIPGFFLFSSAISLLSEQAFRSSTDVFGVIIRKKDKVLDIREYASKAGTYLVVAFVSSMLDTVLFIALYARFGI